MNSPLPTITRNGSSGLVGRFNCFATRGCTILCVLPQSINTVTGCVLMNPVSRSVWADDIPKYAAADRDHNCGGGVASVGVVSFGSGIDCWSSLSTMIRNWVGEHLCPGKIFSGQRKQSPSFRRCWRASGDSFVNGNGFGGLWCVIGSGVEWDLLMVAEGGVLVCGVDVGLGENGLGEYENLGLGWWLSLSSTSWARPHAS